MCTCRVTCVLETGTGRLTISCLDVNPDGAVTLQVTSPCKLYPTVIIKPSHEHVADILFTPEEDCQPISASLMPHGVPPTGNLLPQMKLTVLTNACWHQLEENIANQPAPSNNTCSLSPTMSLSTILSLQSPMVEKAFPWQGHSTVHALLLPQYSTKRLIYATLPQEDRVIGFSELVEHPQLLSFHLETLRTLRATCLHDNVLSVGQVRAVVSEVIRTHTWYLRNIVLRRKGGREG